MFPEFSLPTVVYGMAGPLSCGRVRYMGRAIAAARDYNCNRCGALLAASVYPQGSSRIQTFLSAEPPRGAPTTMTKRKLGRQGLEVYALGVGCMRKSDFCGHSAETEARPTIDRARA